MLVTTLSLSSVGRVRPGEPLDELATRPIRLAEDRLALPMEAAENCCDSVLPNRRRLEKGSGLMIMKPVVIRHCAV